MSGMHKVPLAPDVRKRRAAKNARNAARRGADVTKPCATFADCKHPKHGWTPRKTRMNAWPLNEKAWK